MTRCKQAAVVHICIALICFGAIACGGNTAPEEDAGVEPVLTDLHASVVRSYLHMPANIAMGGYGARTDPGDLEEATTDPRTVEFFFNSRGLIQRLSLKALLLENGLRRVIMLRLPLIFPTDLMRDQIIDNVEAATGENIRYELFLGATHTHHGPARYLETPDLFGAVGLDSFQQTAFIQLTNELTRVVLEVMAAERVPVTFTYGANDNFDPDGRVNRDRRQEDDNLYFHDNGILCAREDSACRQSGEPVGKDPRLHLVSFNRTDGTPFALIANLPVHGTIFGSENPYMSEDAPGLIEAKTEEYFHQQEDLGDVTVMLMQGTAGNVSPGNSAAGHNGTQRTEAVGIAAAAKIAELYRSLPPGEARIAIEYFANRFPISRELIGYAPNEFADGDRVYTRGAFLCGESYDEDEGVPETKMALDEISCAIDVATFEGILGESINMFDKSTVSVMRLGDLHIIGLPGEATTPLGMDLHRRLLERYGIGRDKSVIYAYSNAHQFYLLLEDDWLQGGYETTVNVWGPKFGNYLNDVAADLVEPADSAELEDPADYDELSVWEHVDWRTLRTQDNDFELYLTPNAGLPVAQPNDVERLQRVSFAWEGGDPIVDLPNVWLEIDSGEDGFEPVVRADGRVMSDKGYELLLFHEQDGERSEWTASYEFLSGEPAGTYRFAYWGQQHTGDGTETYGSAESPLHSEPFTLSPSTSLALIDANVTGASVTATIGYPLVEGAYRLRNYESRQDTSDPVRGGTANVTVTVGEEATPFGDVEVSDTGVLSVQLDKAVPAKQEVTLTISVTDRFGNGNADAPFVAPLVAQ